MCEDLHILFEYRLVDSDVLEQDHLLRFGTEYEPSLAYLTRRIML